MKGFAIEKTVNKAKEKIRFPAFSMSSERSPFDIIQEYGLDKNGCISKDFQPFEPNSSEALILEVVASGKISKLTEHGFVLNERPKKGEISRNLALYEPSTGYSYTVGGLGFMDPDPMDHTHWVLRDPLLKTGYAEYQRKRNNNVGGVRYFTNEGYQDVANASVVGTMAYDSGPYHIVRKIFENEKLGKLGINTPVFIAAGPINNFGSGAYGFSIYRSFLTPEYLLNLQLFLDEGANLKYHYEDYLFSKYKQLSLLHHTIGESHGQPTVTNTLVELSIKEDVKPVCQIKDFETNKPLPSSRELKMEDWISESAVNIKVRKTPHAAAMIYDLQLAITQELNVIYVPLTFIKDSAQALKYICGNVSTIFDAIAKSYGINCKATAQEAIRFTIEEFVKSIQKGAPLKDYNRIMGGTFAHALFIYSADYKNDIHLLTSEKT